MTPPHQPLAITVSLYVIFFTLPFAPTPQPLVATISLYFFIKYFLNLFIYLFLAALFFRCCAPAFSSYDARWLLFVAVHGLLIPVASLVVEHGL